MPTSFIDVDFTVEPSYVRGDLGMPRFADYGPSYEDQFGVMSDAEIDASIDQTDQSGGSLDQLVKWILDQKNEGSCVANAITQGVQVKQAEQLGLDKVVRLSPISLYKRIGRSPQSGATVNDGIDELTTRGILPLDTDDNRARFGQHVMPSTGFFTPFPSGWETTAKLFAGLETVVLRSVRGIFTAGCQGHPVIVGRQGHSICYLRPTKKNGRRVIKYANSWSSDWGEGGFGYDSEQLISQSANWAAAILNVVVPV